MHLRVTHTLWKPNHGIPNASGYLTHLPCSSAESSVQRKNRTGPETRTNNCLICRALACCMRLGAVPIAAYFVFSHCNAIFEPKKCNGNCSERCTVKPKIRERCATQEWVLEREGARGNGKRAAEFVICSCRLQATFLFMPSSDVLPSPACLPDKIAADSLSDRMLAGADPLQHPRPAQICLHTCPMCNCLGASNHWPPFISVLYPPCRCWVCATCNWHNRNGKRLATRHKQLARQHNKLSCRIFLPCNRTEIEVWNLVKSASVSDSAGLPKPVILFCFFFLSFIFWLFDRQTGRRQIMPGQNPMVQQNKTEKKS